MSDGTSNFDKMIEAARIERGVAKPDLAVLADLDDEELFECLGDGMRKTAIECLNLALAEHGGATMFKDKASGNLTDYVDADKALAVLQDARNRAEERSITVRQTINPNTVVSIDDAVHYILGLGR